MHQASKHASLKYEAKCTIKVKNRIPVILPENDIYCIENYCQIRCTIAENDSELQKISKTVYFLLQRLINSGSHIQLGTRALPPFALWKTSFG